MGNTICDPLGGAGQPCQSPPNKRAFVSLELDKTYCALAKERFLREVKGV
ncbi:hypothetical protein NHP21005_16400 [Helicobacter sp. NHP21005]|nr:hypothetical protein NHP21005_16400 [Helicobacter sp. NHP21005]